jgi:hypothetical protein
MAAKPLPCVHNIYMNWNFEERLREKIREITQLTDSLAIIQNLVTKETVCLKAVVPTD